MFEFRSKKQGLKKEYLDLIRYVFGDDQYSYWTYNRKYYRHLNWIVNDFFGGPYDIKYIGYTKNKLKGLYKSYVNEELLELGRQTLLSQMKKNYISAAFSFISGNKSKKRKSYCINAAVVTKHPTKDVGPELTIFYRATEIPKKFGADLLFLREVLTEYIPDELREEIVETRFVISLAYVVPIYYPLVYTMGIRTGQRGKMAEACQHQLDRANDLSIIPKYGSTRRVYEFYRRWKNDRLKKG